MLILKYFMRYSPSRGEIFAIPRFRKKAGSGQTKRIPKPVSFCGELGIRTLGEVSPHTRFPVVRLRPLSQLSKAGLRSRILIIPKKRSLSTLRDRFDEKPAQTVENTGSSGQESLSAVTVQREGGYFPEISCLLPSLNRGRCRSPSASENSGFPADTD